ncbi:MAG: hypothetical protein RML72_06085 [Bacteroidia bacterium]|nr:hypothetical protein [Bacteroidia bacterium]MDW8158429.1 hypothetical protein [Bacteroidia bacterium]
MANRKHNRKKVEYRIEYGSSLYLIAAYKSKLYFLEYEIVDWKFIGELFGEEYGDPVERPHDYSIMVTKKRSVPCFTSRRAAYARIVPSNNAKVKILKIRSPNDPPDVIIGIRYSHPLHLACIFLN